MANKEVMSKFIDIIGTYIKPEDPAYVAYDDLIRLRNNDFLDADAYTHGVDSIQKLMKDGENRFETMLLCALYAYIWDNIELARVLIGFCNEQKPIPEYLLTSFGVTPRFRNMIKGKTTKDIADYYKYYGKVYFYAGNLDHADMCIQRSWALLRPFGGQVDDIQAFRALMQDHVNEGTEEDLYALRRRRRDNHWLGDTPDEAEYNRQLWLDDANKRFLSDLIAAIGPETILELGSHAGALGSMICAKAKVLKYIGVEPDAEAIKLCNEQYPQIQVIKGNHTALPDENVDLMLLSCVLLLLDPEDIEIVLKWAASHARLLIIMDETTNLWGDFPITRRYYVLHPYQKLFDKYGFELVQRIYPPEPNLGITGILIAGNRERV